MPRSCEPGLSAPYIRRLHTVGPSFIPETNFPEANMADKGKGLLGAASEPETPASSSRKVSKILPVGTAARVVALEGVVKEQQRQVVAQDKLLDELRKKVRGCSAGVDS